MLSDDPDDVKDDENTDIWAARVIVDEILARRCLPGDARQEKPLQVGSKTVVNETGVLNYSVRHTHTRVGGST